VQSKARWLAFLGDNAYVAALGINIVLNRIGRTLGLPYWSFSNWAKLRVKSAANFIGHYEETVATAAREHNVDGVVCGHIHRAAIHEDFGIIYVNCGDWVESCTAIAEHHDGRFELLNSVDASEPAPFFDGETDEVAEDEGESAVA
jgi:UDP-2,3-diacylglucosamine pyrophosphatase LpxH